MMMVTRPLFVPLAEAQADVLADARGHLATLRAAKARAAEYPGWMFWKKYSTGRNYLVHAYDRTGRGTTLGGETPENAQRLEQFKQEQDEAKLRLKMVKTRVAEHSRFVKAARLNRFPRRAAAVLRAIEQDPARKAVLVDAYALFAYELMLGVLFTPALLEASALVITIEADREPAAVPTAASDSAQKVSCTLAELLRGADRSFVLAEDGTTATSAAGTRVEFLDLVDAALTPRVNPLARTAPLLVAAPLHEPTPTLREMVIDQDGIPLEVTVPDPRVFAAHQYLLSEDADQDAEARTRNRYLAEAVTDALRVKPLNLPPLEPFPDISDTARLGAILHDNVLAGKQGVHR